MSRALAAQALVQHANATNAEALDSIVDGGGDNGIDAIFCDKVQNCLFIVQSKWTRVTSSSLAKADALKVVKGAKDLLNERRDNFPNLSDAQFSKVQDILTSSSAQIEIVVAHTGASALAPEISACFDDYLEELNDPIEIGRFAYLSQATLHNAIAAGGAVGPLRVSVTLFDWGFVEKPYEAFYGQIAASDLAELFRAHGTQLFTKNIRNYLGSFTEVNRGIRDTIEKDPAKFWHLNNGVTALASKVSRSLQGGAARASCQLTCDGFSVVNGAQTVGTLGALLKTQREALENARVMIRIVNLEGCPQGFPSEVTRANNTQNRVDARNFVALDALQENLRTELRIDGIEYLYRQDEIEFSGPNGFGFTEAAVALACANPDVDFSTHAKREVGKLWENIEASPYKALFNPNLSSRYLWSVVKLQRAIDDKIKSRQKGAADVDYKILVHGNRLLSHYSHQKVGFSPTKNDQQSASDEIVEKAVDDAFMQVRASIAALFSDKYLQSLFKNLGRVREIKAYSQSIFS